MPEGMWTFLAFSLKPKLEKLTKYQNLPSVWIQSFCQRKRKRKWKNQLKSKFCFLYVLICSAFPKYCNEVFYYYWQQKFWLKYYSNTLSTISKTIWFINPNFRLKFGFLVNAEQFWKRRHLFTWVLGDWCACVQIYKVTWFN